MPNFEKPANLAANPATDALVITPNDDAELATWPYGVLVGVAGNLRVTTYDGRDVVIPNCPVGILPLRVRKVWATNTAASSLTALW